MGAYSEMDINLRENDAFEEDDSFYSEDSPCAEPDEPAEAAPQGETAPQAEEKPVSTPAPSPELEDKAAAEDAKRKAHEEAEAKRKAEWEARQAARKAAEQEQLDKLEAMSDEEVLAASMKRVGDDTEKLTRRHMMECVMEHIQTLCLSDPTFARKVMHPRKNMIRCCQYINRKAWEYVQDELKAKGITPSRTDPYASAIPEGICYQWAVDYFNDPDAKEDHEEEEKFVPKPYYGGRTASSKKTAAKEKGKPDGKPAVKKETKAKPAAPKRQDDGGQFSFDSFMMPEEKAG